MEIIAPHTNKSRPVEPKDLDSVAEEAQELQTLMDTVTGYGGPFKGIYAMAHAQVEKDEPLRFFVLHAGNDLVKREWPLPLIICNPEIVRHTEVPTKQEEGCVTFAFHPSQQVERWNKIEVKGFSLKDGEYVPFEVSLSGKLAHIVQHEMDHFEAKYVYDITKLEGAKGNEAEQEATTGKV